MQIENFNNCIQLMTKHATSLSIEKQCCFFFCARGSVWYICLKTKNCCLKIFVEIRVNEKVR